jgi:cellulose synthase/poly-beta-1,6-N-acetylglucosamine synthase-like glycosyltransferase
MSAPANSSINYQVAMFAFRVKNWVRPLGLRALNLPCHLMGTGMAFPWEVIRSADLATGAAVEDLWLGLEMARASHPPLFCPSTRVDSQFPLSVKGAKSQRTRWEHGHLGMIATSFPRLFYDSIAQRNFGLLVLTLDIGVPPLTFLGMLLGCMVLIAGSAVFFGLPSTSLIISSASLSAYVIAIMLCWLKFGRDLLPARSIYAVIAYAVGKIRLYLQFVSGGRNSLWIRTDREETKEH